MDIQDQLLFYIDEGNCQQIQMLLKDVADLNLNNDKTSPLHRAVLKGKYDVVKLLIANGFHASVSDSENFTPLHYAAALGHQDIVKLLLENKADVNALAKGNITPICLAVHRNHEEIVKDLITGNANVNAQFTEFNIFPIHVTACRGYVNIARTLLESGANVNAPCGDLTPIQIATKNGHCNLVELFLEKEAEINQKTTHDLTALRIAAHHGHISIVKILRKSYVGTEEGIIESVCTAVEQGHDEIVEFLLNEGEIYNRKDILHAILNCDLDESRLELVLSKVKECGKSLNKYINAKDQDGNTPLMVSIMKRRKPELVQLLLKSGANVNAKNKVKMTALHLAVTNGQLNLVESLLEYKAKTSAKIKDGKTALDLAELRKTIHGEESDDNTQIILLLEKNTEKCTIS